MHKRNKSIITLVVLVALAITFTSCIPGQNVSDSDKLMDSAYDILQTSSIAYNTLIDSAIDLRLKGFIGSSTWADVVKYGDAYAAAHNTAVDALYKYSLAASDANALTLQTQLTIVSTALAQLTTIIQPFLTD